MNPLNLIGMILPLVILTGASAQQVTPNKITEPIVVEFRQQTFKLAYADQGKDPRNPQIINEYLTADETLENWTKLIAVFEYPNQSEIEAIPARMIQLLEKQNPLTRHAIHQSPDKKRLMVDFVTWNDRSVTEFNIFIFEKNPRGAGIIAHQYAERAYGDEQGADFLRNLRDRRPKLLEEIGDLQFPRCQSSGNSTGPSSSVSSAAH